MSATLKDHAHDCAVVGKATEPHTEGGVSKIIELVFHVPINSFWSTGMSRNIEDKLSSSGPNENVKSKLGPEIGSVMAFFELKTAN